MKNTYALLATCYEIEDMGVVRTTAVVSDILTSEIVEIVECWLYDYESDEEFMDDFTNEAIELAATYNVPLMWNNNTTYLEKCPCGECENYLICIYKDEDSYDLKNRMN